MSIDIHSRYLWKRIMARTEENSKHMKERVIDAYKTAACYKFMFMVFSLQSTKELIILMSMSTKQPSLQENMLPFHIH